MKMLYTIRDTVAETIGPIMVFPADAAAVRSFGDVAADPQTNVNRHVGDFELVCLGSISDYGEIDADQPRVVITGAQWSAAQVPAGSDGQLSLIGG